MRGALPCCALLIAGCSAEPPAPAGPMAQRSERAAPRAVVRSPEPEASVDRHAADALRREFGLPRCDEITRLRDVRRNGYLAESWRVRGDDACFADWAARTGRYSVLEHVVKGDTAAQIDRMPWRCGDGGDHVLTCSTQGRGVTLAIEQPNFAPFLLLRRITPPRR
ncbi:hypothetical protein [Sphingomonas sp. VNH70]|uniref:hypothetical protein n=1 Tax=Sphingomonas silueang TaxID=3156617 RepID=UPI0032B5DCDC